jgi:hypothetical protein
MAEWGWNQGPGMLHDLVRPKSAGHPLGGGTDGHAFCWVPG